MDANVITDLSGAQMARLIASKELSPVELTANAYIDRIDRLNPKVNAYVTVCQEEALGRRPPRRRSRTPWRFHCRPSTAYPWRPKTSSTLRA